MKHLHEISSSGAFFVSEELNKALIGAIGANIEEETIIKVLLPYELSIRYYNRIDAGFVTPYREFWEYVDFARDMVRKVKHYTEHPAYFEGKVIFEASS